MNMWHSLVGMYRIRILSPSIHEIVSAASDNNINLYQISFVDDLHADCSILRSDYNRLAVLVSKRGASVDLLSRQGAFWTVKCILCRPVLVIGLLLILLLDLYIPTKILFVKVEGNRNVPNELIIDVAEKYGIYFGSSRKNLRSEKIKNALIECIPELQWVGVNTSGCVATISVQEGANKSNTKSDNTPSSIVANVDGVIQQLTVTSGTPLCKVGQAVKKGQKLVSGYTDLGLLIRLNDAEAEIIADTRRQSVAVHPLCYSVRAKILRVKRRYSLIFGKNIIKLYNGSGISDTTCVKMYHKKQLSLPGGFSMPLGIIEETLKYCTTQESQRTDSSELAWMEGYMLQHLKNQMIAGNIKHSEFSGNFTNGVYRLVGKFLCTEAIGNKHSEEIYHNGNER